MATQNPDGTYNIPEMGLTNVPPSMVPQNLQITVPPVQQAPAAAAISAPGINDQPQQQAAQAPVNFKGIEPVDAQGRPLQAAQSGVLHGPESAGAESAQPQPQGSSEQDRAWNQALLHGAQGAPGALVKGGDKLAAQQWEANEAAPRPGMTQMVDPETGEPVFRTNEYGKPLRDKAGNKIPVMISNAEMYRAEGEKVKEAKGEAEEHEQAAMLRQAGGERALRDLNETAAQQSDADLANLRKRLEEDEQQRRANDADVRKALDDMQRNPHRFVAPSTHASLSTALGQGLIMAGAAAAGQQVPHMNLISDEINRNLEIAKLQAEEADRLGMTKLTTLQQLQQKLGDPVAAYRALEAAHWNSVAHHAEAMTHGFQGGAIGDRARAIAMEANQKAAEAARASYGAAKKAIWQTVPDRMVGGQQGGLPGVIAAIKTQMKGAPKESIDAAINQAIGQAQKGQAFVFPNPPPEKQEAGSSRTQHYQYGARVQLDPMFTGHSGWAYAPEGTEAAANAIDAQNRGRASLGILGELDELGARAGHSLSATDRALIKAKTEELRSQMMTMAHEGMTDTKFESMIDRLNLDKYSSVTTPADLKALTEQTAHDIKTTVRALIPVEQFTREFRGTQPLENLNETAKKKPE